MKKTFKIYGWAWASLLGVTLITVLVMLIFPSHHRLAKDPTNVDRIIGIDLPELTNIQSEDNLDRTASRWDFYTHRAEFTEPLSAKTIAKLEELCKEDREHWYKYSTECCYMYHDSGGIDELYAVECAIYKDHVNINYTIDECEGIFVFVPFALLYTSFIIWGTILCIVVFARWIVRKAYSR